MMASKLCGAAVRGVQLGSLTTRVEDIVRVSGGASDTAISPAA